MSHFKMNILLLLIVGFIIILTVPVTAAIPNQINYQGRLTDNTGSSVPNDTYSIVFAIYDAAAVGGQLWKEEQAEVLVINGIFNTTLPLNTTTFPFPVGLFSGESELFLGISIGSDPEMEPRLPFTSVPFAIKAENADMIDKKSISDLDLRYVNEGQNSVVTSSMIVDDSITASDLADSYVETTGGSMSGALTVEDSLSVGTDISDDDDYIYMDSGTEEFLRWDDDPGIFFLSDGLYVRNTLQVGWTSSASTNFSRFGGHSTIHSDTIDAAEDLLISGSLEVHDEIYADSGKLYLGTGPGHASNDDTIYMDDGSELFRWEEDLDDNAGNGIDGGFFFSDDIEIEGNMSIGTSSPTESIHVDRSESGERSFVKVESSHPSNWGETGFRIETPQNMWHLRMDDDSNNNIPAGSLGLRDQSSGEEVMVWSQGGKVGVGVKEPVVKLEVNGGVKIANDSTTCNSETAGTIRWTGSDFEGCSGASWLRLTFASTDPTIPTVTSSTGRVWMDRNLGASRVATSVDDSEAYGYLYQWGRGSDGHQERTSATTHISSDTDDPGHGDFITSFDNWQYPPTNYLWQGEYGVNNPCPQGFRIPTEAEWLDEVAIWSPQDSEGAYNSPLKLVAGGSRHHQYATFHDIGTNGTYWSSSSVFFTDSYNMYFTSNSAGTAFYKRGTGESVRCIED